MSATGGCECGGVRYAVDAPLRDVVVCHCGRCRRTHGDSAGYTECPAAALELPAAGTLRWYVADGRERGFCSTCGGSLFWRVTGSDTVSIAAGTLDQPTGLTTVAHIFVASAGDYEVLPEAGERFPAGRVAG